MHLIICGIESQKEELGLNTHSKDFMIEWVTDFAQLQSSEKADAIIDLSFQNDKQRILRLSQLSDLVIVNSVVETLEEIDSSFVRINVWPSFLKAPIIEASAINLNKKQEAETVFKHLGKHLHWLDDNPGFVSARIICMIINEAYFALYEGVSTKEDMDTAMKLGTAYPYGPFEWARLIGLKNIANLLIKLSQLESRYQPASLLLQEAAL